MKADRMILALWVLLLCSGYTGCSGNNNETSEPSHKTDDVNTSQPAASIKPSADTRPSISINPCDLINKEMARKVLGADVKDPVYEIVPGMAACKTCYYLTSAPIQEAGGTGSLRISVYDTEIMQREDSYMFKSPEEYFVKSYEAHKNADGELHDIDNLGDKAYWLSGTDVLSVLSKNVYFTLEIKDMAKLSAPTMTELQAKTSEHRLRITEQLMREVVLPHFTKVSSGD